MYPHLVSVGCTNLHRRKYSASQSESQTISRESVENEQKLSTGYLISGYIASGRGKYIKSNSIASKIGRRKTFTRNLLEDWRYLCGTTRTKRGYRMLHRSHTVCRLDCMLSVVSIISLIKTKIIFYSLDPLNRRAISQLEALEKQAANDDEAGPSSAINNDDDNSDMMDIQTDATDAGGEERLPSIEEGETLWSDNETEVLQPYQD